MGGFSASPAILLMSSGNVEKTAELEWNTVYMVYSK